jgi:cytochrome c peroxidase
MGNTTWILAIGATFLLALQACSHEPDLPDLADNDPYPLVVPIGFPNPNSPDDNQPTNVRVAMGKKLFYDPILSRDSSIACASCHLPQYAFSDTVAVSAGVDNQKGKRNSIALFNMAYHPYYMREGGVPTLEMQVLAPISEHTEMDFNLLDAAKRLQNSAEYSDLSLRAYDRQPDAYVITRALAAFERILLSGNSAYDQYTFQGKTDALSQAARRGMALFDTLGCKNCHSGLNFTNYAFENNGLYANYDEDTGRGRLTYKADDIGKFKVSSLRNIALTAPYMHDGSLPNLSAVIEHYATGLKNHPNQSPLLQPFSITDQEKADLIQFLESLSDWDFVANPEFSHN